MVWVAEFTVAVAINCLDLVTAVTTRFPMPFERRMSIISVDKTLMDI